MTALYEMDRRNGLDSAGRWRIAPVNQLGTHVTIENVDLNDDNGHPVRLHNVPRAWLLKIPDTDARSTDPATAHTAAALQTDSVKRASHRLVLTTLHRFGPMTDHALAAQMTRELGRHIGHDNAGKRRLELKRMGYVEPTGDKGITPSGAEALTWRISDAGKRELANWATPTHHPHRAAS